MYQPAHYFLLTTTPASEARPTEAQGRSLRAPLGRYVPCVSCTLPLQIRPTEITDWLKARGRGVTGCGPPYLSLIGCILQHTWLQVGGYRRPRPAQRDRRWASMLESGWKAAALCATESRGAQRDAVVRPWAQAETADSAALDTQVRRSPATSCAPTRAWASLPGWPTASCNCSLKTPRSPARSALLSR